MIMRGSVVCVGFDEWTQGDVKLPVMTIRESPSAEVRGVPHLSAGAVKAGSRAIRVHANKRKDDRFRSRAEADPSAHTSRLR